MADLSWIKDVLDAVQVGGEVASGISKGRAGGRAAENLAAGQYDQNAVARYIAEQNARQQAALLAEQATKDRAERYLTAGAERAQQAAYGDALANIQPVEIDAPDRITKIRFSGGLNPSVFGANARAAGQTLSRDALAAMLSGADVPDMPDLSGLGGDAPALTEPVKAGSLDEVLNFLAMMGAAGGAADEFETRREARRQPRQAAVPVNNLPGNVFGSAPTPSVPQRASAGVPQSLTNKRKLFG